MQKYGGFGEIPVPRSRTWLEDAALETHSHHTCTLSGYETSGKILNQNTDNRKKEDGKWNAENSAVTAESADARAIALLRLTWRIGTKET